MVFRIYETHANRSLRGRYFYLLRLSAALLQALFARSPEGISNEGILINIATLKK